MESIGNFDSKTMPALVSTLHHLPDWISRMIEDSSDEVQNADIWATKLLKKKARALVWSMSSKFGVNSNGVPGLACRLVERYLAKKMRTYTTLRNGSPEWQAFMQSLSYRIPLTMASCIQLASKMTGAKYLINAKVVRTYLLCNGLSYSLADINHSEFQVYAYLGFRIPLWTSVDMAEALVVYAGMSQETMPCVALFVNITEYRRDRLEKCVRWAASGYPLCRELTRVQVLTLHLVAGCVVATSQYVGFEGPDPAPRLAQVTRAPLCYLRCICDVILTNTLDAVDGPQAFPEKKTIKRKLPLDSTLSDSDSNSDS